jgi:hypothetical protein
MTLAEWTDWIKVGLFFALTFVSVQSAFVLIIHLASMLVAYYLMSVPVGYFSVLSALYCLAAVSNITILKEIRYVFVGISALHFCEAVDYFLFSHQTAFGAAYPWLINAAELLIVYYLTGKRGRDFAILNFARSIIFHRANSVNNYIHQFKAALYLHKISTQKAKE